jgi:hypothetical protein
MNDKMEEKDNLTNKINKLKRTEQQAQLSLGGITHSKLQQRFILYVSCAFSSLRFLNGQGMPETMRLGMQLNKKLLYGKLSIS